MRQNIKTQIQSKIFTSFFPVFLTLFYLRCQLCFHLHQARENSHPSGSAIWWHDITPTNKPRQKPPPPDVPFQAPRELGRSRPGCFNVPWWVGFLPWVTGPMVFAPQTMGDPAFSSQVPAEFQLAASWRDDIWFKKPCINDVVTDWIYLYLSITNLCFWKPKNSLSWCILMESMERVFTQPWKLSKTTKKTHRMAPSWNPRNLSEHPGEKRWENIGI